MNLIAAINAVASGATIISNAGRAYTAAELAPITRIGEHAVSYRSVGMTVSELRGTFKISGGVAK